MKTFWIGRTCETSRGGRDPAATRVTMALDSVGATVAHRAASEQRRQRRRERAALENLNAGQSPGVCDCDVSAACVLWDEAPSNPRLEF